MAFYVYILRCTDGSYYTGHTDNLESRMAAHQQGVIPGYTSTRRPIQLVFVQDFPSREQAFVQERRIKRWTRAKKEALISKDWSRLTALAKAPGFDKLTTSGVKPAHPELVEWVSVTYD
jgi:predicted GIY-YIG superfamily endonuclease